MLNRLRDRLDVAFLATGRAFARLNPSPTSWTMVGVALAVLSGLSYGRGARSFELLGGVFLLSSGAFDIVDGAVARATGRVSVQGGFLDSTFDRVAELVVFIGIAAGRFADPIWCVMAVGLSLLVSYARAKGDSLGIDLAGVGIGERSERILVLGIASIAGVTVYGVYALAVLAGVTFAERVARAYVMLGRKHQP